MKEILVIGVLILLIIPPIISILFGGADIGKNKEKFTSYSDLEKILKGEKNE